MSCWVQISAGSGPDEVGCFVALLERRLARRCDELGLEAVRQSSCGPPEAPRSVILRVGGPSIGRLRAEEEGTHALVARFNRRGKAARKRWFAGVVFLAPGAGAPPAPVRVGDVSLAACRSSGPGGQNVNKRSTAVRARHRPTGLSVRIDARARQADNRRLAIARVNELLAERHARKVAQAAANARRKHWQVVRGLPVRTYRLDRRGDLEEMT